MTNLRKIISISFFSIQMVNHSLNAQQQEKGNEDIDRDTVYRLEEVVVSGRQILGSKFKARNRTGQHIISLLKRYVNLGTPTSTGC